MKYKSAKLIWLLRDYPVLTYSVSDYTFLTVQIQICKISRVFPLRPVHSFPWRLFSVYPLLLYRIACFVLNVLTIHLLIFIIIGITDLGAMMYRR